MIDPITERSVTIAGVATRVLGVSGTGPPILLLHGWTDSADTWRPVMRALAVHGRRAVAVDLPGGGCADPLARPALPHHDRLVDGFIRTHGGEGNAVVVGNSLGGFLALRAAARQEVPVGAVVGIGPAGLGYGWRLRYLTAIASVLHPILGMVDRVPLPAKAIRRIARRNARRLTAGRADEEVLVRYASHIGGMRDLGRLRGDLLALSAESKRDPLQTDRIRITVQLIWGSKDTLADPNSAPAFLAAVPGSTLKTLPGQGHCPQLEDPDGIAELIRSVSPAETQPRGPGPDQHGVPWRSQ